MFEAVLRMCTDYDSGLTRYSGSGNPTSRPKMTISWLRPLKALSDADLRIIAQKCSIASGRQLWYFADFAVIAEQRKRGSAVLNAMRWMLKDDKPRQYTFEALMELDIIRAYDISLEELRDLAADAGKAFVDKWKGPACNDFRSQREHEGLLPGSIVQFMRNRLARGPPPPELFHGIAEFHVHSEVKRNCQSHVQIMTSVLELPTGKVQESCLWMVDCRLAAMAGGATGAVDIAKVLQHILFWMVALVGLTHMVPSAVDNGRQQIMVCEGNEDIRADLLSSLQTRQTSSVPLRRTTRATTRHADEGDDTSEEQSPASEDTAVSPPFGNEGASYGRPQCWCCGRKYCGLDKGCGCTRSQPCNGCSDKQCTASRKHYGRQYRTYSA
jgi:hypothetical protein